MCWGEDICCKEELKRFIKRFISDKSYELPLTVVKEDNPDIQCPVCMEYKINVVSGCGHPFCHVCVRELKICPICRKSIERIYKLYL